MTGCPGCGHPGDGDDVLADDQRWCPDVDCPVVSFHADREGSLPLLFDATDRETFREAVETWGVDAQGEMAVEELGEAIKELAGAIVTLQHLKRDRADWSDVHGELADIRIMWEQLRWYFGPEFVDDRTREKMDRLRERLDEAKEVPAADD